MARVLYFVSPAGSEWKATRDQELLGSYPTKRQALDVARQWAQANPPSQVRVQKEDGTWQTEWTYGNDPDRSSQ